MYHERIDIAIQEEGDMEGHLFGLKIEVLTDKNFCKYILMKRE